jgi:outer membrane usher protein
MHTKNILSAIASLLLVLPANAQAPPNQAPSPTKPAPTTTPKIAPDPPKDQPEDPSFEQIFKRSRTTQGVQRIIVPWSIDTQTQGQILVVFSTDNISSLRVQSTTLLANLAEVIRPEILEKLKAAIDAEKNLSLNALRENGLKAIFDERRLELFIQVPAAQRKINVYNSQSQNPDAANAILPSQFSGYLTIRGSEQFVISNQLNGSDTGRQPLNLNFDTALNWNGWVAEGNFSFLERAQPALSRGDFRLVHDDLDNALRYVAGDLAVPVVGYQSSKPLIGLTVARNYGLQPYLITRPVSQYEFFLENPSRVEVFSNGRLVQTLRLNAGQQDIRNLSFSSGVNDVQLIITDDVGRVQRLDFANAIAANLLAPNIQQFAYSFGFPNTTINGQKGYDWSTPTLVASHRMGLSNILTLGGYLQADRNQQLVGIEGVLATALGNIGWDAALSNANQIGLGMAARLRYDFIKTGSNNPLDQTFGFTVEHRGANFLTSNLTTTNGINNFPLNPSWLDLTTYYQQKLFWGITGGVNCRYQFGRDRPDSYQIALNLGKSFDNGVGMTLSLSESGDGVNPKEQRALISMIWVLPQQRQVIQTSAELNNKSSQTLRTSWSASSANYLEGVNVTLEASSNPNADDLTGRLSYNGYRGNLEFSQDALFNRTGQITHTSRLDFGTSLVFADGYFGISRPVTGSFVLAVPHPTLQGRVIGINPSGFGGYAAQIDWAGVAVLPDLSAYQISKLRIDAPSLPVGYDLGPTNYTVLPTYKSGTVIHIGTDATIFLRGTLRNAKDEPLSLQSGEVVSLSDPNWKPLQLFTNKAGKFALTGIKSGRYEIRMYSDPPVVFSIDIPEGKTGIYDLGIVRSR